MSESIQLQIGKQNVNLERSDKMIAVRPRAGMRRTLDAELDSGAAHQVQRHGPLGNFEVVELAGSAPDVADQRARLSRSSSVQEQASVYHTSADNVPFVPEGTIYLGFADGVDDAAKADLIGQYALELVEAESGGRLTVRVTDPAKDAVEVAAELQRSPIVAIAEPDLATPAQLRQFALPGDGLLERQWHLQNRGLHNGFSIGYLEGADARVIAAWQEMQSLGSSTVIVGVIDDGFDLGHPDLAGKAILPFDFTRNSSDVSPAIDDWHGTACAGVALARAGGGQVLGAAPEATLLPVRWGPDLAPRGVARWFDHMTDNGAWIVSCSWGAAAAVFPLQTRISEAIHRCATQGRGGKGCVVLFAAGNDNHDVNDLAGGSLDGFAIHPDVIAVAASTSVDQRSHYSNFGDEIWVCAPSSGSGGWGITTSDVRGTYVDAQGFIRPMGYAFGDYAFQFGGTSSACPLAAGVCALILSVNPDLSQAEVRDLFRQTARKIGDPADYDANGHSIHFGYGCVNALEAVQAAAAARPPLVAAAPALAKAG